MHGTLTKSLGFIEKRTLPSELRERVKTRLLGYRNNRSKSYDYYLIARDCFKALSSKLGSKDFFFGNS
jgi:hypothetical protein